MHEMSIAAELLSLVENELEKHKLDKLLLVRMRYGSLANLVPEAMKLAFEALVQGTQFEGARLELEEIPAVLACRCGAQFAPEQKNDLLFAPCPACGEQSGHAIVSGRELYLQHIEAE